MAVRCRYELEDPRTVSKHFITLTYQDGLLPVCAPGDFDYLFANMINRSKVYAARRYDYSILRKDHIMKFTDDMQFWIKSVYDKPLYWYNPFTFEVFDKQYKPYYRAKWEKNLKFRWYTVGEYGDISHRCHYHVLLFEPIELHKTDIKYMVDELWTYGANNVKPITDLGACNYVGKHQVKSCIGNEFQQIASPSFSYQSCYGGGIGRNMVNDMDLKKKWIEANLTKDRSKLFIEQVQGHDVYKVAYPRFLTRIYHPDKLNPAELLDLMDRSNKNLQKFILNNWELFPFLRNNNFDFSDCNFTPQNSANFNYHDVEFIRKWVKVDHYKYLDQVDRVCEELHKCSVEGHKMDDQIRQAYEKKRLSKKLGKIARGFDLDFNSI